MNKKAENQKEKNIKRLSIIALILSVIGLTIAFLAMSKIAKIDKNGNIKDARWDVHFENLTSDTTGSAKISKIPKISNDKNYIGDFEITLTKPGDSVTFCYDVVNDGTIDAKLQTKLINNYAYEIKSKEKLQSIFSSSDWDNNGITTDDEVQKADENISIIVNFPSNLKKGKKKNSCSKIIYKGDELPLGNIKLNMNIKGIYVQK